MRSAEIRSGDCDGGADGPGGGVQAGDTRCSDAGGGFEGGKQGGPVAGRVHAGGGRSCASGGLDLIFSDELCVRLRWDEVPEGVAGTRREGGRVGNGHFAQQ